MSVIVIVAFVIVAMFILVLANGTGMQMNSSTNIIPLLVETANVIYYQVKIKLISSPPS